MRFENDVELEIRTRQSDPGRQRGVIGLGVESYPALGRIENLSGGSLENRTYRRRSRVGDRFRKHVDGDIGRLCLGGNDRAVGEGLAVCVDESPVARAVKRGKIDAGTDLPISGSRPDRT